MCHLTHRMLRKSDVVFRSDTIGYFVDRWFPKGDDACLSDIIDWVGTGSAKPGKPVTQVKREILNPEAERNRIGAEIVVDTLDAAAEEETPVVEETQKLLDVEERSQCNGNSEAIRAGLQCTLENVKAPIGIGAEVAVEILDAYRGM